MIAWLRSSEPSERSYWLGLLLLFIGLALDVSVATALIVVGAVVAGESVITSYLATWIATRKQ
jgi:hypothetical protein